MFVYSTKGLLEEKMRLFASVMLLGGTVLPDDDEPKLMDGAKQLTIVLCTIEELYTSQ